MQCDDNRSYQRALSQSQDRSAGVAPQPATLSIRLNKSAESIAGSCTRLELALGRINGTPPMGGATPANKVESARSVLGAADQLEDLVSRLARITEALDTVA